MEEKINIKIIHSGQKQEFEGHTFSPIYDDNDFGCTLSFDEFCKAMNKSRYERIISKLNLSQEQREVFESLSNKELNIICIQLWKKK